MIVTRMNADATASIPAEVLDSLGVKPGDRIAFEIIDGEVSMFRYPADGELDEDLHNDSDHDAEIQAAIDEILNDPHPRPTVSAEEAFAEVYAYIEERRRLADAA